MSSIRRYLLVSLLSAILAAGLLGALATYRITLRESDEILDYHLYQVALSLSNQDFLGSLPPYTETEETQFDLVIQVWDQAGVRLYLSHPHADLPGFAQLGYATLTTQEGSWRAFSMPSRNRIIQVAQPTKVRAGLAAGMAMRMLLPFLVIVPLLGLLVWLVIGRGLKPVDGLVKAVSMRNPESLEPLPAAGLPEELRPLVIALNDLLDRLGESIDTLRAFTADAAHELRTPLAALHLQAQLIQRSQSENERTQSIQRMQAGLKRATHVVEQLLTLARQEGDMAGRNFESVDLHALAGQVVAELLPIAQEKGIDLGLAGGVEKAIVQGDKAALRILLANLVDNAVRYTQAGGRVDVGISLHDDAVLVKVNDTGPGIPVEERQRVFDRFYRGQDTDTPGSGLGLAIVQRIARRHDAKVSLHDGEKGPGLSVWLEFPGQAG